MQVDFHHAATYAACRLGGMPMADAAIVAHAAQYVDDATHDGALEFEDGGRYVRATSAHKTLDWQNAIASDNRLIWTPFHFLPGAVDDTPQTQKSTSAQRFERRMICRPNSPVAQQMIRHCIQNQGLPFALQRLGVALHTYVDTWAHQQFVGMVCDTNRILHVEPDKDARYEKTAVFKRLSSGFTNLQGMVAGNVVPVGHAGVLTFPDLPFLKWRFQRVNGEAVARDNPTDFLEAFDAARVAAYRYVKQDADAAAPALLPADRQAADGLLRNTIAIDGEDRHATWLKAIDQGVFSFGKEKAEYIARGQGSWKYQAFGEDPEDEPANKKYKPSKTFLTSNWKRFHDALHYHRAYVLHQLLPAFEICAS